MNISNGCKLMPKMHQNTFGDGISPDPLGDSLAAMGNGNLLLRGGRERKGEGLLLRGKWKEEGSTLAAWRSG